MRKKDNFLTLILSFLIIFVFLITVYFCLDIFGIIDVPDKFSIASFLGNKFSDLYANADLEEVITNDTID